MPVFHYKVILSNGQIESGDIELATKNEVLSHFESKNSIPISVSEKAARPGLLPYTRNWLQHRKMAGKLPLIEITSSIAMLLRAGVSLDNALDSVARAMNDKVSKKFLIDISKEIRGGKAFSGALKNRITQVGEFYVSMVHAGEVTGKLDESMQRLNDYLEKDKALKENIVSALLYPIILLCVTLLSIVILMVVVMPKFKQLFDDMGGEIPLLTRMFIDISDFITDYGVLLFVPVLFFLLFLQHVQNKPSFKVRLDAYVLRIPWYGKLFEKQLISNFSQTLSLLLKNGVSIQHAIRTSRGMINNSYLNEELMAEENLLNEGRGFAETIGKKYPPLIQQMIRIGESAGELENTLEYVAITTQQDIDRTIKRILGVFEPLMIVFLGLIVAAVISSIMLAVLDMNDLVI